MKRRITQFILFLSLIFSGWPAVAENSGDLLATIGIDVKRDTRYTIDSGQNASELMLNIRDYPPNILNQLQKQFSAHFVACKVVEKTDDRISLRLIVLPGDFRMEHRRLISPQRIEIRILPPKIRKKKGLPGFPLLPLWEMLVSDTLVIPELDYDSVPGEGEEHAALLSAARLFQIGAYEAAAKRIDQAMEMKAPEYTREFKMMQAEIWLNLSLLDPSHVAKAREALFEIRQEATQKPWKGRAELLAAYTYVLSGEREKAREAFQQGAAEYESLADYFLLGLLQNLIEEHELDEASRLIGRLESVRGLSPKAYAKLCFSKVAVLARRPDLQEANHMADICVQRYDKERQLNVADLLVLAETRMLHNRFGEAKEALQRVIRDYFDNPKAAMAVMREGDIFYAEHRYREAMEAYGDVAKRWPDSPYARIAELKNQFILRKDSDGKPLIMNSDIDIHNEPAPVSREAKLRVMWHYADRKEYVLANVYLTEIIRRDEGLRYWPYAPEAFRAIVMGTYDAFAEVKDNLEIVALYQSGTPYPFDLPDRDRIAHMVGRAYRDLKYPAEAARVYQKSLGDRGRSADGERRLLVELGHTYLEMDDIYRAEKTLEYFSELFTDEQADLLRYRIMGRIKQKQGKTRESLVAFEKAMRLTKDPRERQKLGLEVGVALYHQKKYAKVAEILALALEPFLNDKVMVNGDVVPAEVRDALFYLADSQFTIKDYKNSRKTYLRAASLFPNDDRHPIANFYAAQCALEIGLRDEAIAAFEIMAGGQNEYWKKIGQLQLDTLNWYKKHDLLEKK